MMNPTNKPSHRVYAVSKRGDKSYWTDIGVVWAHKDGKGFKLTLDYLPLTGAELVIREPQPDGASAASSEA